MNFKHFEEITNEFQLKAINVVKQLISDFGVKKVRDEVSKFKLERGNDIGGDSIEVKITFKLNDFDFEFYLYENQLEYYIIKNDKVVSECNLEDYDNDEVVTSQFKEFFYEDCKKNNINRL